MSITASVENEYEVQLSNGAMFDLFQHLGITLTGTEGEFTGADILERLNKFTPDEEQKRVFAKCGIELPKALGWMRDLAEIAINKNRPIELY